MIFYYLLVLGFYPKKNNEKNKIIHYQITNTRNYLLN